MQIEISANPRTVQGTGASRRLRHAGKVPAVLYGAGKDAAAIELDHNDIFHKLRNEAFHASILTLNVGGKKEQVLLRDYQMHPYKQLVMHVDFQRVSQNEKIHMKVPLHFVNEDVAPGVKLTGGNISHIMMDVEVSCLPKNLPEFIEVDLGNLTAGHSIHLSELKLPKGVELIALNKGEDLAVATILMPRGGAGEEEAAPAAPAPAAEAPKA
ncbi:MAG: 50S ribosomal protein L25/general stress protein Ctc [Pseudomonadota bacterium]